MLYPLSQVQQCALEQLRTYLDRLPTTALHGGRSGRSLVLQHLHAALGGKLLTLRDWIDAASSRHPFAIEDAVDAVLTVALRDHDVVLVDDLEPLARFLSGCGSYPRSGYLDVILEEAARRAERSGKRIVFGDWSSWQIGNRGWQASIGDFTATDYEQICGAYLSPGQAAGFDYARIFRFASSLDAYDLRKAAVWCSRLAAPNTNEFLQYLEAQGLSSNVCIPEVRQVSLRDLRGVDDLVAELERHVVLPMRNEQLAARFQLHPKRGVLLYGPPGTGKTTVGRALAHELRGKFFRIDGRFIAGTGDFYHAIDHVFQEAASNAPAVVFIDDCDVIFAQKQEYGLYRYLLTMLDGIESKSMGRVCVMLTAMDARDIPAALVRSGRIELWLETRLPDEAARLEILSRRLSPLEADLRDRVDLPRLAKSAEGLSGADLESLVEDAKNRVAHAVQLDQSIDNVDQIFQVSLATLLRRAHRHEELLANNGGEAKSKPRQGSS